MPCKFVAFCGEIQHCTHPNSEAVPRSPQLHHCLSAFLAAQDEELLCYDEKPERVIIHGQMDLFEDSSQVIAERCF